MKDAHLLKGYSVRNLRIIYENGAYYAIFTVWATLPTPKPLHRMIALDPNHKNFAYGVAASGTAIEIAAPTWLKKYDKRREQTKTFMFTLAHALCKRYDCIAIGDYAPKGNGESKAMRRSMNTRSLIGRFKGILLWTAKKSGKVSIEFNEKGTTRTCHACGYVHEKGLVPSIRRWSCPACQTEHIRDENAAINGLRKAVCDLQEYGTNVPS